VLEWTISTMLILFTVSLGLLCVLVLSCTLTQTRMSNISIDGVNISIWKLDDIRKHWSDIREQIRAQSDELTTAQKERSQEEKAISETDKNYSPMRTQVDALLGTFRFRIEKIDEDLAKAMTDENFGPVERLDRIDGTKDRLLTEHPELKPLIDKISELGEKFILLDAARIAASRTLKATKDRVQELQDSLKSLQDSLGVLIATQSGKQSIDQSGKPIIDEPTRERVENALFELFTSATFAGRFINSLIVTPPDILTLTLVISMGLLGSALQMTHALFMHHRIDATGVYFLRLSVGAITALVIFIVTKAGVPVVTDSSRLDLREAFKKANRNPDNVSRLLTVEASQFNAWISGKDPIPTNAQMMIAGVLDMPRRDLFTDLPPEEAKQPVDGT
jgi:hypothetical protein